MKQKKNPAIWLTDFDKLQNQFSFILDATQNGILAVDLTGEIILANQAVRHFLLGDGEQNLIGRYIGDIFPDTLLLNVLENKKPLAGQRISNGTMTVIANYSPIYSEQQMIGAISVLQDVSVLEKAFSDLESAKELTEELEAIFESSYDGMFVTDADGVVIRVNKSYERISGIPVQNILGRNMSDLVKEGYFDQSVTLQVMKEQRRLTMLQKIKGEKMTLVTGNPIFDGAGILKRIVTNVRDITELHEVEEKLHQAQEENLKYEKEVSLLREMEMEDELIFRSPRMSRLVQGAVKIAGAGSAVLITGESGTGKEVLAKLIHKKGQDSNAPFLKVNCAAIPENLLDLELFGSEGRKEKKLGLFDLASGGTLFLDEVGELPMALQAKLFQALQDREYVRSGSYKPVKMEKVRIIAATHENLEEKIRLGRFREDLYYRLAVIPIDIPPLRDREEDVPLLIATFLDEISNRLGKKKKISSEVMERLLRYPWPGNVRELENVIEQMIVVSEGKEIRIEHVPERIKRKRYQPSQKMNLKEAVEETERYLIGETYKEEKSWTRVSEILGMDRASIYRKAKRYGLLKKK